MLVIRITVSMLMLTGGTWCKGENFTRSVAIKCLSVFSLRFLESYLRSLWLVFKDLKTNKKRITESLRANQRHLLTKRAEGDVYLKRLKKRRLISEVKFAKKIH